MTILKSTLAEQIYQILRTDILEHNIPMGEKLTLKTLKERFEVSSTPIRDALTRLSEEGLVVYYSNVGVSVISLTEEDLKSLYQFMGDLDGLAIYHSSFHPEKDVLVEKLEQLVEETSRLEALEQMTPEEIQAWIRYSDQFHLAFYDYCQNDYLKTAAEKLRSRLTIFSNIYEQQQEPQKQINDMHKKILEAYRKDAITHACELMGIHLQESLQYALDILHQDTKQ